MDISSNISGSTATIVLPEKFDLTCRTAFHQLSTALLGNPELKSIQIDLAHTRYLDSSALGMLLLLKTKAEENSKEVALTHCQEPVREILTIASFDQFFSIT